MQDIFSLLHLGRDFKFVSKGSIFMIPVVGWSMWVTGAPFPPLPPSLPAHRAARLARVDRRRRRPASGCSLTTLLSMTRAAKSPV